MEPTSGASPPPIPLAQCTCRNSLVPTRIYSLHVHMPVRTLHFGVGWIGFGEGDRHARPSQHSIDRPTDRLTDMPQALCCTGLSHANPCNSQALCCTGPHKQTLATNPVQSTLGLVLRMSSAMSAAAFLRDPGTSGNPDRALLLHWTAKALPL